MSRAIFKAALSLCFVALLAACGTGPAAENSETTDKGDSSKQQQTSGQTTTSQDEKASRDLTTLPKEKFAEKGVITKVGTTTAHAKPHKWIRVEADPTAKCHTVRQIRKNGSRCDKTDFEILDNTRVLRDVGCDGEDLVQASAADLKKGQRVRAWARGAIATTFIGQGHAKAVVICDQASASTTNAASSPEA